MFILFWRTCVGSFFPFFQANSSDTLFSKVLSCFVQANKKTLGRSVEHTLYTRFFLSFFIYYFAFDSNPFSNTLRGKLTLPFSMGFWVRKGHNRHFMSFRISPFPPWGKLDFPRSLREQRKK